MLDCIWFTRNDVVFSNNSTSFRSILCKANARIQAALLSSKIAMKLDPLARNRERDVSCNWNAPPLGFVKMNVDAAVKMGESSAGCGGIVRDQDGNFIFGFSMKISQCPVLEEECLALLHGLRLIWGRGFRAGIMESDSQGTLDLINDGGTTSSSLSPIIEDIRNVMADEADIRWSKVNRENNRVAACLARHSFSLNCNLLIYKSAPIFIQLLLLEDKEGLDSL